MLERFSTPAVGQAALWSPRMPSGSPHRRCGPSLRRRSVRKTASLPPGPACDNIKARDAGSRSIVSQGPCGRRRSAFFFFLGVLILFEFSAALPFLLQAFGGPFTRGDLLEAMCLTHRMHLPRPLKPAFRFQVWPQFVCPRITLHTPCASTPLCRLCVRVLASEGSPGAHSLRQFLTCFRIRAFLTVSKSVKLSLAQLRAAAVHQGHFELFTRTNSLCL